MTDQFMARRPLWRAAANRLNDLAVAREWIYDVALHGILAWGAKEGSVVQARQDIDTLWYRHELVLFQRPETGVRP